MNQAGADLTVIVKGNIEPFLTALFYECTNCGAKDIHITKQSLMTGLDVPSSKCCKANIVIEKMIFGTKDEIKGRGGV